MNNFTTPLLITAAVAIFALMVFGLRWRITARQKKQDREKVDQKLKEDILDRALSNGRAKRTGIPRQSQTPAEVHYNCKPAKKSGAMIRLTEQAESVTREYLFQQNEMILLGEEYGRSAVFREQAGTGSKVYCELFPYQGSVCVRGTSGGASRLLRGKQSAPLTAQAVRLRSGDKIETQVGAFLVELF